MMINACDCTIINVIEIPQYQMSLIHIDDSNHYFLVLVYHVQAHDSAN